MLVGSVMNVSVTATNVSYTIGDGTGYIDVRKWLDSADEDGQVDANGQYVPLVRIDASPFLPIALILGWRDHGMEQEGIQCRRKATAVTPSSRGQSDSSRLTR